LNIPTSDEQRMLLDSIDRFMAQHLPPAEVRRRDEEADPPYHLLPLMGEMGLLGITTSEADGGLGGDWQTLVLAQERMGYHAFMAVALLNRVTCFGLESIRAGGSAQQRQTLIPKLISGEAAFSLALTEPGAGSDAGGIITRATKVDGGWRINGRKTWISGAESATFMVTACRTGEEKRGTRGVTMFLIPPDAAGISMTPLAKVGNNCSLSWDIGFEDVFVPDDAVLGEVGKGFSILRDTLKYARAGLAASVTGVAQAAVDCALSHAKERRQFGRSIGSFQTISHRLADMQTAVDLSRLLVSRLAGAIDGGEDCTRLAAQAKLVATEALHRVTDDGMQIMASAGYAAESDMQRYWRDARLYTFGEGSNEIQRGIIARDLGLTED
tara:strand:+ start:1333 stop:2484 length:1152 start_codon:yes stop_codon:yes gene_type:complete